MKMNEIRELSDAEIAVRLDELGKERFSTAVQARTGKLDNPSKIRSIRRDVARIKTELNRRRSEASSSQGA